MRDPGTDPIYCDGLSQQRCARCQCVHDVSEFVQVPGIGQICEECDDALLGEAMTERFPKLAKERE